ncbi:hypothetical protein Agub_g11842 [Astrephomene gubernaculifera]|uniref:Uncharacterized protein n=1 Tax=Astrephomene gubernaculifera TaxID=47775 RepID=A0AAD3DZH2_9CHLO|nr:hypothetical protein Agub_g11842 [Astrephomene gubernaculifera]
MAAGPPVATAAAAAFSTAAPLAPPPPGMKPASAPEPAPPSKPSFRAAYAAKARFSESENTIPPPPGYDASLPPGVELPPSRWAGLGWVVPVTCLPLMAGIYWWQKESDNDWGRQVQQSVHDIKQQFKPAAR